MNPRDRGQSICFLTNAYPDASCPYPMYGRFIGELVQHLVPRNVSVSVVTPRLFQSSKPEEARRGEKVYRFWFWSESRRLIEYSRTPVIRMLTYLVSGLFTGLRVVREDSCSLVHAHWVLPSGLIAVWISRILKKPVVLTVHGSDAQWAFNKKGLLGVLFRWAVRQADSVTTVSQNIATRIESSGVEREKISVFPMGVSDTFFSFDGDGFQVLENDEKTVIISNRLLLPLYNVECLIRAIPHVVSRCDKVLFLVANDGERRFSLESMAQQMDLSPWVRFIGSVAHVRMPALLKSSHIYVSTSLSDGTSVSLLEAMACGVFPVVTDIPANREWIEDGKNGFLVPIDNALALADKLNTAIKDEALRKSAKQINIKLVKEGASWARVIQNLMEIYEKLATP